MDATPVMVQSRKKIKPQMDADHQRVVQMGIVTQRFHCQFSISLFTLDVGGINLYLQQKFPLCRHTPRWLDRWLDSPPLLRAMARRSQMTSARDLGEMTLAMLRFEHSGMAKEMDKLCQWLERESPDVLCLSTALQAGLIRSLKRRLGVKVIARFQGEDSFLDSLSAGCISERCKDAGRTIEVGTGH